MVWFSIDVDLVNVAAATAVLMASYNAAALALRPFTIVRTRAVVQWTSDQAAASEDPAGAIGEIIVSEAAAAAGVASLPTPTTEFDADWLFYQALMTSFTFADATGFQDVIGQAAFWTIDSKAMRKVGLDETAAIVVENTDAAFGAQAKILGRQLVKLH